MVVASISRLKVDSVGGRRMPRRGIQRQGSPKGHLCNPPHNVGRATMPSFRHPLHLPSTTSRSLPETFNRIPLMIHNVPHLPSREVRCNLNKPAKDDDGRSNQGHQPHGGHLAEMYCVVQCRYDRFQDPISRAVRIATCRAHGHCIARRMAMEAIACRNVILLCQSNGSMNSRRASILVRPLHLKNLASEFDNFQHGELSEPV